MANRGAMTDEEVQNEMRKMTQFIRQEALEKAREIQVKADEEHNIEKAKLVRQETLTIEALYAKKHKQALIQRRIQQSNHVNKSRLKVLQQREETLNKLHQEAKARLGQTQGKPDVYKGLVQGLLTQAVFQLIEQDITIICRKKDVALVESLIPVVAAEVATKSKIKPNLKISQSQSLDDNSAGGIIATALDGRILCNNTLEGRLELAREKLMPAVRMVMFGPAQTRAFFD